MTLPTDLGQMGVDPLEALPPGKRGSQGRVDHLVAGVRNDTARVGIDSAEEVVPTSGLASSITVVSVS